MRGKKKSVAEPIKMKEGKGDNEEETKKKHSRVKEGESVSSGVKKQIFTIF